VPLTYVLSADVARCLAEAVNAEDVEGERFQLMSIRSLSMGGGGPDLLGHFGV
jgi:hypothetical protein